MWFLENNLLSISKKEMPEFLCLEPAISALKKIISRSRGSRLTCTGSLGNIISMLFEQFFNHF